MSYLKKSLLAVFSFCVFINISCRHKEIKKENETRPVVLLKKDSSPGAKNEVSKSAPIINITDTIALKLNVISIKDSALTTERLTQKLAQIYGSRLAIVMKQNKLKLAGAPIAWYRSSKVPYFFEAGLPVDKKPAKLPKNVSFKKIGGDSAVIAHFYGPYELTGQAYDALEDWLKSSKKHAVAPPYEIYVSDPLDKNGKPVDPYRVQTDIVFPHN